MINLRISRLEKGSLFLVLPLFLCSFLLSCAPEPERISSVDFDNEEFADFVERDFPYVTTSIDARSLGDGFPEDNISARAFAIPVADSAYMAFDPDMLRWTVAWEGDFLPMVTMAQISYRNFYDKNNKIPTIGGDPRFATGQYLGWAKGTPTFEDPRPANPYPGAPAWGPVDEHIGRWEGHYLTDQGMVLSYTVSGIPVLEMPGFRTDGGKSMFTRTLRVGPRQDVLHVVLADIRGGAPAVSEGEIAAIRHGVNNEWITAATVAGSQSSVRVQAIDDQFLVATIPASAKSVEFSVGVWVQSADTQIKADWAANAAISIPDHKKGSKSRWSEKVYTRGVIAPDTATFVTDHLTLPVPNPWKRNVRVVDLDFLDKSRAAVVTFDGDVWILEGISQKLDKLAWKRFASGLYEPQAISVVDGDIYVFGKEGILRLHDLNGDGEADHYENFSNIMAQSIETREWASDMVKIPEGGFYIAKFGALDMGPETSSPKAIMGFRAGSQHGGAVFKISEDGRQMEMIASGFRGPYLGIDPKTGLLTGSDQQGHHMPSTPVMVINKGDYYGVSATAHRQDLPEQETPPLTWIPHAEDRSGVSQVWVHSDKMGPLNGKMMHLSYGRPGLFQVLVDNTGKQLQGAVSVIRGEFRAPTMKAEVGPADGLVYIAGFALWGHKSDVLTSLIRLRYTGSESYLPEKLQARRGGVMLRFGVELDEKLAGDPANYLVKRWNYERTGKYGSGHFKLDGESGEEQLPVAAAKLSKDKKAVFLAIPDMREVMQMEVAYQVASAKGMQLNDKIWFTVNDLAEPSLLAEGFEEMNIETLIAEGSLTYATEQAKQQPTLAHGKELYAKMNCIACHAIDGATEGRIGPPVNGLFGTERKIRGGSSIVADEDYITESILEPSKKIVYGYDEGMPSFLGVLSETDVQSLVMYIKSL